MHWLDATASMSPCPKPHLCAVDPLNTHHSGNTIIAMFEVHKKNQGSHTSRALLAFLSARPA